ncbi:MAG: glycoside hydrolase family 125 protein [Clostridia bacterium]|nr:glycoside hydrolase family 125 protein [Clostridia bacterium]
MKVPSEVLEYADVLEKKTAEFYPDLAPLAKRCYLNTIETTVKECENGDCFVITGDIPALWLRDSAAQLRPYMPLLKKSEGMREIIKGVIRRHAFYVCLDPYANAFNEKPLKSRHSGDETDFCSDYIWERKYETDSLCASVYLLADYVDFSGDTGVLTPEVHEMLKTIIDTFVKEQRHNERSSYFFHRKNCPETDTMPLCGKGNPVAYTGMTWSGFRPSDDRCVYNYLIPANMMCVVASRRAAKLFKELGNEEYAEKALTLADEVEEGIKKYGVVRHEKYGRIYAYETDGMGNFVFMDDANSPSLLSLPYLGYCEKDDELYLNTRRFILSEDNPFYFEGKAAKGVGSPHTGKDTIWHISLIMQILTSLDEEEKLSCLKTLSETHAGTFYMHESFNKDDASDFTRSWFAWANSLFAQMLEAETENITL